jgi:hypothetical protein
MSLSLMPLDDRAARQIPALIRERYGDSYSMSVAYDPEALLAFLGKPGSGAVVGQDERGRLRAFMAWHSDFPGPGPVTLGPSITAADLDPIEGGIFFRGVAEHFRGLFPVLADSTSARCLVAFATMRHDLSLRLGFLHELVPCGLLRAHVPPWANLPIGSERPTSPVRRAHTVMCFPFYFRFLTERRVHIPAPYEDLVHEIYLRWGIPVRTPERTPDTPTRLVVTPDPRMQKVVIEILTLGSDAGAGLDAALASRDILCSDLVHVAVPLTGAHPNRCVAYLRTRGFHFGALLPYYRGGDVIIMQRVRAGVGEVVDAPRVREPLMRRLELAALSG